MMPKSTKATKVTDKNKAWNKKSQPSGYKIDCIPMNKTILIVCEGQTEKLYFESFPVLGVKIKAIDLKGQAKLKLVESTGEIIENEKEDYNEVWCVFDMDVKRCAMILPFLVTCMQRYQNLQTLSFFQLVQMNFEYNVSGVKFGHGFLHIFQHHPYIQ